MKQKLFTLLTLLFLCVTGAWAAINNTTVTKTGGTQKYIDVGTTAASTGDEVTVKYQYIAYTVSDLVSSSIKDVWYTQASSGSGSSSTDAVSITGYRSACNKYIGLSSSKTYTHYVTNCVSFSVLYDPRSGSRYVTITATNVDDPTDKVTVTNSGTVSSGTKYNVELTGLDASKYYSVVVSTNNGSESRLYQIRLEASVEKHKVTYKAGTGTGDDVVDNEAITIGDCPNTFTAPAGLSFAGWNTAQDGSGTPYAVGANITTDDLVLYAQWDKLVNVTWSLNTGTSDQAATISMDDVFSSANISIAKLTAVGVGADQGITGTKFQPTASASDDKSEYVKFTVTPKKGMTFVPTHIEFDAMRWGTDGSNKLHYYAECGDDAQDLGNINPARNGKGNGWTHCSHDISGLSATNSDPFTLALYVYGLGTDKQISFANIVIKGTYSGTPEVVTTYDVEASIADGQSSYGTINPAGVTAVEEGESLTITATPNTGYDFVSWTLDGADGGTTNPLTLTNVTENHAVVANFKQLYSITLNVAAENKGTSTVGFATQYANASDKWTPATNYYVAKEGYTLTKWNDGTNDYVPGTEYTLAGNITIEPVFTANTAGIGDLTEEKTVTWTFARSAGAPNLASEGNTQYYVQQTTIAGNTVDVPIFVNTVDNYGIEGKRGKFNNSGNEGYAQVNAGTVFKIPAAKGMVVKYMTNQTTAVGNIGFTDDTDDLGGDGTALTNPTVISSDNKTISYTYTGTADYLYLVDIAGGKYPTGISVTYPEVQTKYLAPTITVGDFSFEDKGYKVTITATEGTLQVSTDGTNYTEQTSPYQVNVTSTTHFYAKATGTAFDPSDVTEETVTNTFDATKSYVAWVYESNYVNAPNNYAVASDEIYKGLADVYNVVLVDIKNYKSAITDEQKAALNGNLDDADLVVISEAAAGASKAVIAMKDLVGVVPMLNMKLYSYSSDRWGWGSPQNLGKAVANVTITPVSKYYKVLENVTFDGDNVPLFAYPNEQNHIQYVESWANEPTGDVVLANVTVSEASKPAMHASTTQKYFALGISCDDFGKYNDNVITIIKNAAAMLIAGEDLAAVTAIEKTIPANKEWITFCSTANLDFSSDIAGLEGAYTITAHENQATTLTATKMTGTVKAGTGLLLRAKTVSATDAQAIAIPVAATGDEQADNMLKGVIVDTEVQPTAGDYTNLGLSNGEFHPYSAAGTLAAGKAYLQVPTAQMPTGGNNARLYIVLDGEATGIANVDVNANDNFDNAPMYNLAGQKVSKSYKGIVIVNGKKYINK